MVFRYRKKLAVDLLYHPANKKKPCPRDQVLTSPEKQPDSSLNISLSTELEDSICSSPCLEASKHGADKNQIVPRTHPTGSSPPLRQNKTASRALRNKKSDEPKDDTRPSTSQKRKSVEAEATKKTLKSQKLKADKGQNRKVNSPMPLSKVTKKTLKDQQPIADKPGQIKNKNGIPVTNVIQYTKPRGSRSESLHGIIFSDTELTG